MARIRLRLASPSLIFAVAAALTGACRAEVSHLEPVQKMAYRVKPAVVRVSAFATARFHFPARPVNELAERLAGQGVPLDRGQLPAEDGVVETGTGGSGSGFILHPDGWILTSGHVVEPTRNEDQIRRDLLQNGVIAVLLEVFPRDTLRSLARGGQLRPIVERLAAAGSLSDLEVHNEVVLSNGDRLPFRIREFSPPMAEGGTDLALIRVNRKNLPTLAIGDSDRILIQEPIWIAGYPSVASTGDEIIGGWLSQDADLEATFNPGTITAIKKDRSEAPVFQTDAPVYHGNSGGPAVNRLGQVIGIPTWGHSDADQIRFLIPINTARAFVARAGVPLNVEGAFNGYYRMALDEASDGDWKAARGHLVKADTLFRGSPDLIRFLRESDQQIETQPGWRVGSTAGLMMAAVVLLIAGIGGAVLVRSQSRPGRLAVVDGPELIVRPGGRQEGPQPVAERAGEIRPFLGRFTILNGERAGQNLNLGGSGIRIGRESALCEIVLTHPKVSRLQAEVVEIDGQVLLIDRSSSNGTWVNDHRIDRTWLRDGDIIYFGGRNAVAVAFHV